MMYKMGRWYTAIHKFAKFVFGGKSVKKLQHFILIICIAFLMTIVTVAQAVPSPRFGSSLALLTVPETFINVASLSAQGDYVIATANQFDYEWISQGFHPTAHALTSSQYLWHIPDNLPNGLNWLRAEQHLILDKGEQQILGPDFAVSPDNAYVAVRTDSQVKLYRFPSFILQNVIPTNNSTYRDAFGQFNQVKWSSDSRLIATLDGNEIVSWDIKNGEVYRYDLGLPYSKIEAVQVGWFATLDSITQPNAFAVCTWNLGSCSIQDLPKYTLTKVVFPDGSLIITQGRSIDSAAPAIWRRQPDETYELDQSAIDAGIINPVSFSPSGRFLLTGIRESYEWILWDFPRLESVSTIPERSVAPIWLPDSQHLLTFDAWGWLGGGYILRLYQVGSDTPLDELKLPIQKIGKFELNFSTASENYVLFSGDGKRLFLKAGFGVFVIPIIYE